MLLTMAACTQHPVPRTDASPDDAADPDGMGVDTPPVDSHAPPDASAPDSAETANPDAETGDSATTPDPLVFGPVWPFNPGTVKTAKTCSFAAPTTPKETLQAAHYASGSLISDRQFISAFELPATSWGDQWFFLYGNASSTPIRVTYPNQLHQDVASFTVGSTATEPYYGGNTPAWDGSLSSISQHSRAISTQAAGPSIGVRDTKDDCCPLTFEFGLKFWPLPSAATPFVDYTSLVDVDITTALDPHVPYIVDANGDGNEDVVLMVEGSSLNLPIGTIEQHTYLGPFADLATLTSSNPSSSFTFANTANFQQLEDVTGDGIADQVVWYRPGAGTIASSQVWIFEGPIANRDATTLPDFVFETSGPPNGITFGIQNVVPGDFNGDGYNDLMINMVEYRYDNRGTSYIFLGPMAKNTHVYDTDAWATITGPASWAVASFWNVGDVDGDRDDDIVMQVPQISPNNVDSGWFQHNSDVHDHDYGKGILSWPGSVSLFADIQAGIQSMPDANLTLWGDSSIYAIGMGGLGPIGDLDGDGLNDLGLLGLRPDNDWEAFFVPLCAALGTPVTPPDTGLVETGLANTVPPETDLP